MSYIDPVKLRQKFNTEAGREAFDRLQKIGNPRWVFIDEGEKVYLSPSIEIKQGSMLSGTGAGWGQNIDDIVIQQEKEIVEFAIDDIAYAFFKRQLLAQPWTGRCSRRRISTSFRSRRGC